LKNSLRNGRSLEIITLNLSGFYMNKNEWGNRKQEHFIIAEIIVNVIMYLEFKNFLQYKKA
jgi:hypothetical protein